MFCHVLVQAAFRGLGLTSNLLFVAHLHSLRDQNDAGVGTTTSVRPKERQQPSDSGSRSLTMRCGGSGVVRSHSTREPCQTEKEPAALPANLLDQHFNMSRCIRAMRTILRAGNQTAKDKSNASSESHGKSSAGMVGLAASYKRLLGMCHSSESKTNSHRQSSFTIMNHQSMISDHDHEPSLDR